VEIPGMVIKATHCHLLGTVAADCLTGCEHLKKSNSVTRHFPGF
jgi:hypothetical protein